MLFDVWMNMMKVGCEISNNKICYLLTLHWLKDIQNNRYITFWWYFLIVGVGGFEPWMDGYVGNANQLS